MDDQTLQEPDTLPWSGLSERSVSEVVKPTKSALRLKIKVPKANDFCGEESFDNQSCGTENRVCKFCKKGFSSGKALGGHMRVHAQDDDILGKNQNSKLKVHHPLAPANNGNYKASNATNNPTCSLCGKSFPSMKSLFGHMRCHPEREWRGIQPPPPAAKNSSSSTVSDSEAPMKIDDQNDSPTTTGSSAFNLTESLPRWSVTAKRGRKSIAPASSEEQKIDAIYNLVMLAHGIFMDSARSVSDKKRISELSEATSSRYFPSKKLMVEDRDHVSENLDLCKKRESGESQSGNRELQSKKLKIDERRLVKRRNEELETRNIDFISNKVNANKGIDVSVTKFDPEPVNMDSTWDYCIDGFGEDSKQSREDESDSKTTDDIPVKQITCMMKKRKKKMKLRYLETVGDMDLVHYKQMPITTTFSDKYYCSTCNKSFSSHQALGGHKSSHKKDNNSLPIIADMDVSAAADASAAAEEEQYGVAVNQTPVDGLGEFDDARSRVAISTHRCKICNKTFPTGQALGGHKRCHWTGPVEAPSSSVASLGEVSKIGRAVLDFDLNEVPVMEEEGLESGCTQSTGIRQPADYASSSYKSVA